MIADSTLTSSRSGMSGGLAGRQIARIDAQRKQFFGRGAISARQFERTMLTSSFSRGSVKQIDRESAHGDLQCLREIVSRADAVSAAFSLSMTKRAFG